MARKTPDMAEMFLAFQAFMESQGSTAPAAKPATRKARATRSSGRTTPKGTDAEELNEKRTVTRTHPTRKTPKGVITCEQAWQALGADPTYKPSDPNAPARNGQLWALNAAGKLRLA